VQKINPAGIEEELEEDYLPELKAERGIRETTITLNLGEGLNSLGCEARL